MDEGFIDEEKEQTGMELQRVLEGGNDQAPVETTGLSSPYPEDVAKVLSHLANLIDSSIQLRGVGSHVSDFAAGFLGCSPGRMTATSKELNPMQFWMAAETFAADLEAFPPLATIGDSRNTPPRWEVIDLGDLKLTVPCQLASAFSAGSLAGCPLVVFFDQDSFIHEDHTVTVFSRLEDAGPARAYLDDLLSRSRKRTNAFKGRILEATYGGRSGLSFKVAKMQATQRSDVILPGRVWEDLDENVHGFFSGLEVLKAAGLARNRGILLEGPPGTGKTALCRALAQELKGVTVVFCDSRAVGSGVQSVYEQIGCLSPAAVVMEDIDLIVGHRHRSGASRALNDFLLALDGAISNHEGVVTIATTNDLAAIDSAAKRSARFDRVITIPLPEARERAGILSRYLSGIDGKVDLQRLAAVTEGASGADLRELVSAAVIRAAAAADNDGILTVTTDLLLKVAAERFWTERLGNYL